MSKFKISSVKNCTTFAKSSIQKRVNNNNSNLFNLTKRVDFLVLKQNKLEKVIKENKTNVDAEMRKIEKDVAENCQKYDRLGKATYTFAVHATIAVGVSMFFMTILSVR